MKKTLCLLLCLLICIVSCGITVAWLGAVLGVARFPTEFTGSANAAYFAGGDGSEESPYIINSSIHLYNFAWLQYLGYFNLNTKLNNGKAQNWFRVEADIDMSRIATAIPPIGTAQYPFFGNFNGGSYTISGVKISNQKSDLKVKPSNAKFSDSLLSDPSDGVEESGQMIGLFGVIGDYGDDGKLAALVEKGAAADSICVENIFISGLDVTSNSTATTMGLIAGYVNANVSNIGVAGGSMDVKQKKTDTTLSANVSDYGLIGYCTPAYRSLMNAVQMNIKDPGVRTESTGGGSGSGSTGYGSLDMKALYDRLYEFYENKTGYTDAAFTDTAYSYAPYVKYWNQNKGSVYYYRSSTKHISSSEASEGIYYLIGGKKSTKYEDENAENCYFIGSGNSYLSIKELSTYGIAVKAKNEAVTWSFSDENQGGLYTVTDGQKYYLNTNNFFVLQLGTSQTTNWVYNEQNSTISCTNNNGSTFYLQIVGGYWRVTTSLATVSFGSENIRRKFAVSYSYEDESKSFQTYLPLATDENNNVDKSMNTGYIASGGMESSGDIRVKKAIGSSSLDKFWNNGTISTAYTVTKGADGSFVTTTDFSNLNLNKYNETKELFNASINNQNFVYGLHFMSAQVTKDRIYTISEAYVNGTKYDNYQMPANSIDFKINKGYITFFAGTFWGGENNFFSLYEVFRDENTEIIDIKEISKIYSNANKNYIYLYSDGNYSATLSSDYEEVFDVDCIRNPGSVVNSALYYFEIPVNAGEYALGSSSAGNGAYLLYLDIGTKGGEDGKRTEITENFGKIENEYKTTTSGVALVSDIAEVTENNLALELSDGFTGVMRITVATDGTIVCDTGTDGMEVTGLRALYLATGVSVANGGNVLNVEPTMTTVTTIKRLTYYDSSDGTTVITRRTDTDGQSVFEQWDGDGNKIDGADYSEIETADIEDLTTDTILSYSYNAFGDVTDMQTLAVIEGDDGYFSVSGYTIAVKDKEGNSIDVTVISYKTYTFVVNDKNYAK